MSVRAYVLLDVMKGQAAHVARALKSEDGVRMVDVLETPPDVMMVVGAPGLPELVDLTIRALVCVEAYTEGIQIMSSQGDELSNYVNPSPPSEVINSDK